MGVPGLSSLMNVTLRGKYADYVRAGTEERIRILSEVAGLAGKQEEREPLLG
jgi:hypothetical protein